MCDRPQETLTKEPFHDLARQYKTLNVKIQELELQLTVLQAQPLRSNLRIENLKIERNDAMAHRDIARRHRGHLANQLRNRTPTGTPIVDATANRKTTKMPDPPILRDGKQVRCETWETVVRQTLEANADHYPLPVHRKLCVRSRCEGKPRLSIAPRITSDSSNPYVDAEDIMVHLKTGCANPNRRAEAYAAYRKLIMKPKDDFPDFLAEFILLAEEAAVLEETRKWVLYSKLPYRLQCRVGWAVNQDTMTVENFSQTCQSISRI